MASLLVQLVWWLRVSKYSSRLLGLPQYAPIARPTCPLSLQPHTLPIFPRQQTFELALAKPFSRIHRHFTSRSYPYKSRLNTESYFLSILASRLWTGDFWLQPPKICTTRSVQNVVNTRTITLRRDS